MDYLGNKVALKNRMNVSLEENMSVSYKKLFKLLIDLDMKKKVLLIS